MPGHAGRVGGADLDCQDLGGQHHEKHVREERDGVDPVGQRTHVGPAGALGEPPGLDGVAEITDQNGNGGSRKHATVDDLGRKAQNAAAVAPSSRAPS